MYETAGRKLNHLWICKVFLNLLIQFFEITLECQDVEHGPSPFPSTMVCTSTCRGS